MKLAMCFRAGPAVLVTLGAIFYQHPATSVTSQQSKRNRVPGVLTLPIAVTAIMPT